MTLSEVKALKHGDIVHHSEVKNADGTPARGRCNGKVKTWKRDPSRVQVPMKHGLYDCFYITEQNMADFELAE